MAKSPLQVLVGFEDALMESIIEKEKAKPKPKQDGKESSSKPKRVGGEKWNYTKARYLSGDR